MSATVISLADLMSVADIAYDRTMGRWEPDARGRLARAALTLYAEQGFEQTTVAEIAARAGLTERTFFRHFTDKREALFDGSEQLPGHLARAVEQAPPDASPLDAVTAALDAMAALVQQNPERARLRNTVVATRAELRERELIKLAETAAAVAGALRARGVPEPAASLAAETGVAVFRVSVARWLAGPGQPDLAGVLHEALASLRDVLATRTRA